MTANCRSKNIDSAAARRLAGYGTCAARIALATVFLSAPATAQTTKPAASAPASMPPAAAAAAAPRATDPVVPPGYVIGTDDMLSIVYWKDKDMSADAKVRPDGRIALPLINEVQAAGLTPEQLQQKLTEESKKYLEDASITVVVREINSRKAFITGEVNKPGPYPLTAPTTVMQLISLAGGLRDYANSKNIMIMRTENGKQTALKFNYKEVASGKKLNQNIELKPGDTVVVP
ncbi:MAG TPA: polysaccharide biosynthesis/export family protein [Vicinamibacterales bacterium]|nr:polysaccharide biosynthesis/export family protein [Vicinamibacterales bacterium]